MLTVRNADRAYSNPNFVRVRTSMQEFVLVNLTAAYTLTDRFRLFGRVENMVCEQYEELFSFVTPGAAAFRGVGARF